MTQSHRLVQTKQYTAVSKQLFEAVAKGENVGILFFPYTDKIRRMEQFTSEIDKRNEQTSPAYHYLYLDPFSFSVDDTNDLQEMFLKEFRQNAICSEGETLPQCMARLKAANERVVIIVLHADAFLEKSYALFVAAYHQVVHAYRSVITTICCFEKDVTDIKYREQIARYTHFFQHIIYYRLYDREDAERFVQFLYAKWEMPQDKKEMNHILDFCGGHFWFIKEAVREIASAKTWDKQSEGINYRKEIILQEFSENHHSLLVKLLTNARYFSKQEEGSLLYFQKMGFVDRDRKITIPLLRDAILAKKAGEQALQMINNTLYLNTVPVDIMFSRKELRVLKLLLSSPGVVVTRDAIAHALWPTDTTASFSDWAIDQIIARIRKRLMQLLLPSTCIRSVRGRGYMYQ